MAGFDEESGPGYWASGDRLLWPAPAPAEPLSPLRRPLSWLCVGLIRCYQGTLSRLWPNVCMYHPSCSHYAIHAVVNRGLLAGGLLGAWRILRCHPFARGGYDPPPGYEEAVRRQAERESTRDAGA